jgi:hypothetical protein
MREAENLAATFGDVFPVLPDLLGFANDSQNCGTQEPNDAELLRKVVELTGIEPRNGHFTKLSAHAVLAEKSRKSLGKLLPFGPVGCRPVPAFGAELRQPDGNASGG